MNTRHRLAGLTLAVGAVVLVTSTAGAADHESLHGTFTTTSTGATAGYDIHGSAKLTVVADSTTADVNIAGLDPALHYGSHLHDGTCASGGGNHYRNAPAGAATPPNELWLSTSDNPVGGIDSNPGGVAHASGSAPWTARLTSEQTNARSIVVHAPGGARIACADLS